MNKKIYLWALYDFANSIVMIVFLFYFSQWLVVDSGKPDWWYNATLIISSLLFILTAPIAGQRIDATGKKLSGLRIATLVAFIFYFSTALVTLFSPSLTLLAAILFTLAMYSYLLTFVFYTPMLSDLSMISNRAFVSGMGQGANYGGQVAGLLITLPLATGALYLFGAPGRAQTLLPATVIFGLLTLPMLLTYKEELTEKIKQAITIKEEYIKVFGTLKHIISLKNLLYLFIAYFLFSDALLTFSNNFPIFLEKVHGAEDAIKTYLTAGILILSAFGAVIFGKIADKKGKQKTLGFLLIGWTIFFPVLGVLSSFTAVIILCLIAGLFFGPVWGISRAMVADHAPKEIEASSFSFYILAERFATFIGPLMWSIALITTTDLERSYAYGLTSMGVLTLLSLFFLSKMNAKETYSYPSISDGISK